MIARVNIERLTMAPIYKATFAPSQIIMYDYDLLRLKRDTGSKLLAQNPPAEPSTVRWYAAGPDRSQVTGVIQPK